MTAPVLTGDRCQCTVCGLYFNSDYAFCKHRVGLHMPMERRCLSPDEMRVKGMCLVGHFWVSKRRAAQTIPVDAIPSKPVTHFSDAPVVPATYWLLAPMRSHLGLMARGVNP